MDFEMAEGALKVIEGKVFADLDALTTLLHDTSHVIEAFDPGEVGTIQSDVLHAVCAHLLALRETTLAAMLQDKFDQS
jgi:hypothetical protein